jgi:mono/diheme cytochrome c family protein
MRKGIGLAGVLAAVVVMASTGISQEQSTGTARVDEGRALFDTYCASCHGRSGRGDGPALEKLHAQPADLTGLAKRNGGVFVAARIERIIDGREVKAHGSFEMPVWGDALKRREGLDEQAVKARIEAIVRYLKSIQQQPG